jgi:hypothetical protein
MKKAYIVLAHKNPEQVYRLIKKLDDNNSTFFIHVDKKVELKTFNILNKLGTNKVIFIKREDGQWGGFGIVQASLNGLMAIEQSNKDYDQINLISGQDYPIKNSQYTDKFYQNSTHTVFLETFGALPVSHWPKGGFDRINKYFFGLKAHQKFVAKIVNFFAIIFPPFRRKIPYNLTAFGGSQWWTIDMYAMKYILNYIKSHKKVLRFFKYGYLSDELFFQTILLNSTDQKLLNGINHSTNNRYIIIKPGQSHPILWKKEDLLNILNSEGLLSRKFDTTIDSEILDLIDENS